MATSPEPFGESPTTKAPVPVGTCNINIAFDGDVIFALQQTRLRVSSAILFSASPVFKRMFGPNFAEGQGERSSKNPRKITLSDDDVSAMTKLCRILHHQSETRDTLLTQDTDHTPAETIGRCIDDLFALTVVSDKYDCSDSVEAVVKYLLSEYASPSLCERMSARATLVLSAIAYKIYDCRHFALFTRRLVLDFGVSYSNLAGNYALEELPYMFLCKCTVFHGRRTKRATADIGDSASRGAAEVRMDGIPRQAAQTRRQAVLGRVLHGCRYWGQLPCRGCRLYSVGNSGREALATTRHHVFKPSGISGNRVEAGGCYSRVFLPLLSPPI